MRVEAVGKVHAEEHAASVAQAVVAYAFGDHLLRGDVRGCLRNTLVGEHAHLLFRERAHQRAGLVGEFDVFDGERCEFEAEALVPAAGVTAFGGNDGGDFSRVSGQLRDAKFIGHAVDGGDEGMEQLRDELLAAARVIERIVRDVCRNERADESVGVRDLDRKRAVCEDFKIGAVVLVVVRQRSAGAEFKAANLAQVDERDLLVLGAHAGESDAFGGLVEQDLADARVLAVGCIEYGQLPIAVFEAAGCGDDLFDARLAEDERGCVFGNEDHGAVGQYVLRSVVRSVTVLFVLSDSGGYGGVFVERGCGDDVFPLIGEYAADGIERGIENSHINS